MVSGRKKEAKKGEVGVEGGGLVMRYAHGSGAVGGQYGRRHFSVKEEDIGTQIPSCRAAINVIMMAGRDTRGCSVEGGRAAVSCQSWWSRLAGAEAGGRWWVGAARTGSAGAAGGGGVVSGR